MTEALSPPEIRAIHKGCRNSFALGKSKPMEWRSGQLNALECMLAENETTFCEALAKDLGKSVTEAFVYEISFVISASSHARKNLANWMRDRRVSTPLLVKPGRSWVRPEPLGTVLIISPWNYPLQLCLAPLITAISAGNCAVIKPSELAPATSAALAKITPRYLDSNCIRVIEGGVEASTELLELDWDHIVFTGGEKVARIVMTAAARHLTPVTLELGGKSPCIVLPDADLDIAARRIAWGRFTNCGQTCIAPDYILTDQRTAGLLIPKLQKEITEMFGEDPKQSKDYGRIVNQVHFDRLTELIYDNEVSIGGQSDRNSCYIAPTVLHPVNRHSLSMQGEIFGPVLPIMEVAGLEQAIDYICSGARPLAAYLFSKNEAALKQMVDQVSAGSIGLNDVMMFMAVAELPFGGVGASGMGTYAGESGFRQLSHEKAVLKRSWWPDWRLRYAPSSSRKLKWLRKLR